MDSVITFFNENEMLIYALLCLVLLILLCFMPRKKKHNKIDNKAEDKTLDEVTDEDIKDITSDDTFIYEQADFHKDDKVNELDNLLAVMQEDLEKERALEEVTEEYEDEQEKTAIISYQELLKAARENKIKTSYDDEKIAVISTSDNATKKSDIIEIEEENLSETKKFKNSDFISPIFGKQESVSDYPKVPNFNHQKQQKKEYIDEELVDFDNNSDEEFLESLIAFRNNLK